MHRLAEAMIARGRLTRDAGILVEGHRMMATSLLMRGELVAAAAQSRRAVAFARFRPDQHPALLLEYGVDPAVGALVVSAAIHSLLGQLTVSARQTREALRLARRLDDPRTLAFALTYTALACVHLRDPVCALERAEAALALCREHHFDAWLLVVLFSRGWALVELGRVEEGFGLMSAIIQQWRRTGWWTHLPGALAQIAEFHLRRSRTEEGLRALEEAREWRRKTGVCMEDAEQARIHGELLRQLGQEGEARRQFLRALVIARRQHNQLSELRVAIALARQLRDSGQHARARRLLDRRCHRLHTRHEPRDLVEARALVAELSLTHEPAAPAGMPAS
jgi:tetratricopeptide (TPR) repeat protein